MGIQIIPSPGDQIAQSVDSVGNAIDKFLNPNRAIQQAVQKAASLNPDLLQTMGDLESDNPGLMRRLGLGKMAGVIEGVAPSTKALIDRATRPDAPAAAVAAQKAAKTGADATTAKNMVTADIMKKASSIMAADPSISFDAALRTLTGETSTERAVTTAESKEKVAKANIQIETLQRAGELPKDMKEVDWRAEAMDFVNGNIQGKGAKISAFFGNPDTSKAFQEAIDVVKQERQIAASQALAALHGDKSVDNFRTQKAFQEYQKSGGVGNLDAWHDFLFDPVAQARARELLSGSQPKDQKEKDLMAIAKVTKTQVDTDKLKDIADLNNKINGQMKIANASGDDQERQIALNGLNQLFQQRGALGGIEVKATYNDRGFFLPGRIEYKDKNGKMVDEAVVNAIIADPLGSDITARGPGLNDRARNALAMIQNFGTTPGEKAAALERFKVQDRSPNKEDSRAVEAELMRSGVIPRGATTRMGGNTGEAGRP